MTDVKYPRRGPFVAAGIFMIFCAFMWILRCSETIIGIAEYGIDSFSVGSLISILSYLIFFFVFGIVLMAAKNSIGTIILLGMYTAQEVYWVIDTLKYSLEYSSDIYGLLLMVVDVFQVIALIFLFVIALISRINQKNGFVKAWFVPFIFGLLSLFAMFAAYIVGVINFGNIKEIVYSVLILLFVNLHTLAIMFYGIGLKVAMNKKPAVKVASGENQNYINSNVGEEKPSEINIPSPIKSVHMPKPSPIMEPVTETLQNEIQAEEQIAEIRKYKQLLDDGIITEEEFNRKKQEILGL